MFLECFPSGSRHSWEAPSQNLWIIAEKQRLGLRKTLSHHTNTHRLPEIPQAVCFVLSLFPPLKTRRVGLLIMDRVLFWCLNYLHPIRDVVLCWNVLRVYPETHSRMKTFAHKEKCLYGVWVMDLLWVCDKTSPCFMDLNKPLTISIHFWGVTQSTPFPHGTSDNVACWEEVL